MTQTNACLRRCAIVAATLGLGVLTTSCAPEPPKPLAPAASVAALLPPAGPVRKLPHGKLESTLDWYPPAAKRLNLTGRTLVEFHIGPDGRATDLKVVHSEADPVLQTAALDLLRHDKFDVADPKFDAADPTPFRASVSFCLVSCGALVPYPGYEANSIIITGSAVRR